MAEEEAVQQDQGLKKEKKLGTREWVMIITLGGFALFTTLFVFMGIYLTRVIESTTDRMLSPIEMVGEKIQTEVDELLNPTPTVIPDPITIVRDVRALARMETVQYSLEKVITAEIGQGQFELLFGDRLLFVAHGTVIAGIDFQKLRSEDLWVEDGALFISMPESEILVATLDNDKSYVFDRETGILTKGDQNLETTARRIAEEEILKSAIEDGILEKAQKNGELFLAQFFDNLGYEEVIFIYPILEEEN